jgi:hypothetical protein
MLSTSFKNNYDVDAISKISLISESDSFIYGILVGNVLEEAGRLNFDEVNEFIESKNNPIIKYGSKSKSFTHIDEKKLPELRSLTHFQNIIEGNPPIYCCFNDDNLVSKVRNVDHFSGAIHHQFKYEWDDVIYVHLNKTSVILCLTGRNGFRFYNEFDYETSVDILYFLKSVMETTHIEPKNTKVFIGGYIEKLSEMFKIIYRYVDQIIFAKHQIYSVSNNVLDPHVYFDHILNLNS